MSPQTVNHYSFKQRCMKTNYNQTDEGKKAGWLHPLFKPLLTMLVVIMFALSASAQLNTLNMTGLSFCWDDTQTTTIGLDGGYPGMYHVLYHFKPDGSHSAMTTVYPTTADPFNFVVNYGGNSGEEGLYVTYVYTPANYLTIFTANFPLPMIAGLGVRQGGEVWIYDTPDTKTLGFYGSEGTDYTVSGSTAVYCSGSAGVDIENSESSPYSIYVGPGSNDIIDTDEWQVKYVIFDGTTRIDSAYGDGGTVNFQPLDAAPTTYTAKAYRGTCASVDLTGSPEITDQARVKNTNTGLCYLTIQEGIDDALTINGHTLICLLDEAYTENVTIDKELTLMADPVLSHFQLDIDGYVSIEADNVTIQDFDGIYSAGNYAIMVNAPANNYLIDSVFLVYSALDGINVQAGAGGGTISNCAIGINPIGVGIITGVLTAPLTIENNTIEGSLQGIYSPSSDLTITGNLFNDVLDAVAIDGGNNISVTDNDFSNITSGGTGVLLTGTNVEIHDNNFGFVDTYAIRADASAYDAENNWYGDPTGPTIASNPCGLGSEIFGIGVDYSPWWFDAAMTTKNGLPAITVSDIPDMSTITMTPLIISTTVDYTAETISDYDPTVLTDARIISSLDFPAGSKVISVLYEGTEVLPAEYLLPANDTVYLSDILGGSGNPLAGHEGLTIDWDITIAGFDTPWTSTINLEAVSYIDDKTNCNNILDSDELDVTYDNATLSIVRTDVDVCTDVDPLAFDVVITYPVITGVNTDIKAQAKITSVQQIPAFTEIKWGLNGPAVNSYFVPADSYELYLSDIVGLPGPLPLQGNVGPDTWSFEIPSVSSLIGAFDLTIEAMAVLGVDEYVYASDTVGLDVRPLPTASLSASGSKHICEGTDAALEVSLTGTGPWDYTITDGITPENIHQLAADTILLRTHFTNKTWKITTVSDAYCSNTSTDTVRIYVGTITYAGQPFPTPICEGSDVFVPIIVENFEDVGALSLTLNYDKNALEYVDFTTKFGAFPFTIDGDSAGVIKAGGFGTTAYQIPDLDTIFVLQFVSKGLGTTMKWDTTNFVACEYVSFETGLPFCDTPNNYYYRDMAPAMTANPRPKVHFSGNDVICNGETAEIPMTFTGTPPFQIWFTDGVSTWSVSGITNINHTLYVTPTVTTAYWPTGVTDASGCVADTSDLTGIDTVFVNPLPTIDAITPTMVTCNGADDGSIDLTTTPSTGVSFIWSGPGGFSSTSEDISDLAPGTYYVTVTIDATGCQTTGNETITEPDVLLANRTSTNVTCNGADDGTITVYDMSGGYGTYETSIDSTNWYAPVSPATDNYEFTGLAPGSYRVLLRDAAQTHCYVYLQTFTITEPAVLSASVDSSNITCNGANDGTIEISNPLGGYGTYEYWITGASWQSSGSFTALAPGSYEVKIRDAAHSACEITLNAALVLTEPAVLSATVTGTNVTCNGADDGEIDITSPAGGYGTYEYMITGSNWQSSGSFSGLTPGSYEVKIRDAAHTLCVITLDPALVILEPDPLTADAAGTDITCFGADDGIIEITNINGGWGTYEFSIDGGTTWQSDSTFSNLGPDLYDVFMRDAAHTLCTAEVRIELRIEEPAVLDATVTDTDITCNGADDGIITVTSPTGGWGTYEVMITGGSWTTYSAPSVEFTNLGVGGYNVYIRDAAHIACEIKIDSVYISQPDALSGTATGTNITCNGADDGIIEIDPYSGGYGTYEFSIDGGTTWQTGDKFENLEPDTYNVVMRDAAHTLCTYTLDAALTLTEPDVLSASVDTTNISCNGADDATISITNPAGGYGTYEYSIDGSTWYNSGNFTSIGDGTYEVRIRDAAHTLCVVSLETVTFVDPAPITLSGFVTYYDTVSPAPLANVTLYLTQGNDTIQNVVSNGLGAYNFSNVCPGTYTIRFSKPIPPAFLNPVNVTDAYYVALWAGNPSPIQKVQFMAGDVLMNNQVLPNDATRIMQYFLTSGIIGWCYGPPATPVCSPVWKFFTDSIVSVNPPVGNPNLDMPTITVAYGDGPHTIDFYGLFTGDFNFSWEPPSKTSGANLTLNSNDTRYVDAGTEFMLPMVATSNMEVGAVSMIMNFPSDKLEIVDAYLLGDENQPVQFNLMGDELRLGWNSVMPVNVNSGQSLVTLKLRLIGALAAGEKIQLSFNGSPLNELADGKAQVIPNVVLNADMIAAKSVGITEANGATLGFGNYPNPFNESTTFVVNLPFAGYASIEVYDMLGKRVNSFLNQNMTAGDHKYIVNSNDLKPGVYTATLSLKADGQMLKRTIKIIRNQ